MGGELSARPPRPLLLLRDGAGSPSQRGLRFCPLCCCRSMAGLPAPWPGRAAGARPHVHHTQLGLQLRSGGAGTGPGRCPWRAGRTEDAWCRGHLLGSPPPVALLEPSSASQTGIRWYPCSGASGGGGLAPEKAGEPVSLREAGGAWPPGPWESRPPRWLKAPQPLGSLPPSPRVT